MNTKQTKPKGTGKPELPIELVKQQLREHMDALKWTRDNEQILAWQRNEARTHADALAEALRILQGCAERGLDQSATHDGISNASAVANARQALAAYDESKGESDVPDDGPDGFELPDGSETWIGSVPDKSKAGEYVQRVGRVQR